MSETPKRKRLIDDHVTALWDSERLGGPTADPGPLEADHIQAREDRKRLADRLRATVGDHDDHCNAMFNATAELGCNCETGRLLAEVDS